MNLKHAAILVDSNITTCKVVFPRMLHESGHTDIHATGNADKSYTYKITRSFAKEVQEKELPLVIVQANGTLSIGVIIEVHEDPEIDVSAQFSYKWVVCEVDTSSIKAMEKEQEKLIKALRAKQRAVLREQTIKALGYASE